MIEFIKRAAVSSNDVAVYRRYRSLCRNYAVVEVRSSLGEKVRFLAIRTCPESRKDLEIISRHRGKGPALRACEKHLKINARRLLSAQ